MFGENPHQIDEPAVLKAPSRNLEPIFNNNNNKKKLDYDL